jgi:hypothetical protein
MQLDNENVCTQPDSIRKIKLKHEEINEAFSSVISEKF